MTTDLLPSEFFMFKMKIPNILCLRTNHKFRPQIRIVLFFVFCNDRKLSGELSKMDPLMDLDPLTQSVNVN